MTAHNNGPPEHIAPGDLFVAISKYPRPFRVVDFPRKDADGKTIGEVALRILSQEEHMESAASAERYTAKLLKERPKSDEARRGYDDVYTNAAGVEVLFRACRRADDIDRNLFPSPESIRQNLIPDEVGVLVSMYLTVQSEMGPIYSRLSDVETEAWITRLAEAGSALPLSLLSEDERNRLVVSMAVVCRDLLTDKSSPGSE